MPTRRRLMAALALVGASLAGGALLLQRRGAAAADASAVGGPRAVIAEDPLAVVVEFVGVLFGHALTAEDRNELLDRLNAAIGFEPEYAAMCSLLAEHAERSARKLGAASFIAASDAQRRAVVEQFMNTQPDALLPRLLAHLSRSARNYYAVRWNTIPALAMLYRRSGLPWRARGYSRWPGVPGRWSEYLEPGPANPR